MSCFRNFHQGNALPLLDLLLRVVAAHLDWDDVVFGAVNYKLLAMDVELGR